MRYLRKLNEGAWADKPPLDSDSISDIATQNHELSVWQVSDDLKDVDKAALAIALTKDKTEGILYAILNLDDVKDKFGWEIMVECQAGATAYVKLKDDHKNLMVHNLEEMGRLANHIHDLISSQSDAIGYIDEMELVRMIDKAVTENEISMDDLSQKGKWKKALKNFRTQSAK